MPLEVLPHSLHTTCPWGAVAVPLHYLVTPLASYTSDGLGMLAALVCTSMQEKLKFAPSIGPSMGSVQTRQGHSHWAATELCLCVFHS